ncbi:serine hydrolase [Streptomyces sp. TRM64462]|uniref:serine hydrolase domain-containing protein n=1 Tax=Streptomyces sp. TRM64462 TaxID=2741726 RepID=UPI001586EF01|nr:serine hydrolase domain-containing protein [Streptomyces sp. TRM64462]
MPLYRTLLVVPLVLAICGLALWGAPSPSLPTASPSPALARLVSDGRAPAAALLAETPGGTRFETTGPGIGRADRFRAGSITKTFIATVVLQLAAERRLSLDDRAAAHTRLPQSVASHATLRHLLTHTSSPPRHFAYSNTNYVLLGDVIEHVTGNSYAAEANRRIIRPLGLTGTSFPGSRTTLPSPHGTAYDSAGRDVTALDPRIAGAAGELISTLDDLNRFYAALLDGTLLPPAQLRDLLDTTATAGRYGMGLSPTELPCGVTVWGHNGRIPGSYVRTAATRDGRQVLTFRTNTDTLTATPTMPPLETTLLEAAFCPASRH